MTLAISPPTAKYSKQEMYSQVEQKQPRQEVHRLKDKFGRSTFTYEERKDTDCPNGERYVVQLPQKDP